MEHSGKVYQFDYDDFIVRVHYLSDQRLSWEQIKGPEAGLKAEQDYAFALIRPAVYFFWWQEKDRSVVTQVVDFEEKRVHTTWISPENKVMAFHGTIRRKGP